MALALAEAIAAGEAGEVPVGAVIVKDGEFVATGRNGPIEGNDPTAHAELVALRNAAQTLSNYRLGGCTLYVTLEPCAMCAGAMLHARIDRVVYGARDPKTGAAESVLNLFSHSQLNHHTAVQGGVLAAECGALLADFFKMRRIRHKALAVPLREDVLRTADVYFEAISTHKFVSHYLYDSPTLAGLRMHYLDEGSQDSADVLLCLHSNTGWGFEYWAHIADWVAKGKRVIVPDLIGFGRSDKFKRMSEHSSEFHSQCLVELLCHLGVGKADLAMPSRGVSHSANAVELTAPFPDKGYKSALLAFKSATLDTQVIGRLALNQLTNR